MDTENEIVNALHHEYGDKFFDQNIDRKLKNIDRLKKANEEEVDDFEFIWPAHLDELKETNHGLYQWFEKECKIVRARRKCLVLFSRQRSLGKKRFAKMLTGDLTGNDQKYYLITRGLSFTKENFTAVANPKLLILDDVELRQVKQQEAIPKALVSSESVTIRDAFTNIPFKRFSILIFWNNLKNVKLLE